MSSLEWLNIYIIFDTLQPGHNKGVTVDQVIASCCARRPWQVAVPQLQHYTP